MRYSILPAALWISSAIAPLPGLQEETPPPAPALRASVTGPVTPGEAATLIVHVEGIEGWELQVPEFVPARGALEPLHPVRVDPGGTEGTPAGGLRLVYTLMAWEPGAHRLPDLPVRVLPAFQEGDPRGDGWRIRRVPGPELRVQPRSDADEWDSPPTLRSPGPELVKRLRKRGESSPTFRPVLTATGLFLLTVALQLHRRSGGTPRSPGPDSDAEPREERTAFDPLYALRRELERRIPGAGPSHTTAELVALFEEAGPEPPNLGRALAQLLRRIDAVRFGGGDNDVEEVDALIREGDRLLGQLDGSMEREWEGGGGA